MAQKKNILDELSRKDPFKVPEGYFDNFTENLISNLPEREIKEAKTISLWERVKPWTYMAAMFIGIALMLKIFTSISITNDGENNLSQNNQLVPTSELEEFYSYCEDQYANNLYRQAFLLEEYPLEMDMELNEE